MITKLLIKDYNGSSMIVETRLTADELHEMIDDAFDTGKYSIRIGTGFSRIDVRNIASIVEYVEPPVETTPEEAPVEEEEVVAEDEEVTEGSPT